MKFSLQTSSSGFHFQVRSLLDVYFKSYKVDFDKISIIFIKKRAEEEVKTIDFGIQEEKKIVLNIFFSFCSVQKT